MHIVVGKLSAIYSGRGETELTPYDRIVIRKADGTVSIHADKGFKPMNYMATSSDFDESVDASGQRVWRFSTNKEALTITFHEVYDEINLNLGDADPGFASKDGTERQLQQWLAENLNKLDSTLHFLDREYQTGAGPVDLLGERDSGAWVAIEIKRLAPMNTVGQLLRYVDALKEQDPLRPVQGVIAAVEFKARTLEIAAKKNVQCLTIPANWLEMSHSENEVEPTPPARTLFDETVRETPE